ncbi:hypothetical protein KEM48_008867 [Puccinia striiformis f. sp. tritici PST-130]|nr:hypothetical protein KEM48_008867 [Puccinia striiformis f. sp. tritici PST-130]
MLGHDNLNHSYNRRAASEVADDNSSVGHDAESDSEDEGEDVGMDPADWGYPLHFDHDEEDREEEEDEGPGMHFWDWHWGNETSANNEEPPTLDHNQSNTQPGPHRSQRIPANAPWYLFPTKEELAYPLIVNHMEFVPHDPQGHNIHSLHQSTKWREDLTRNLRVPMVTDGGKHFYIYEPVGLVPRQGDSAIVVPIFFFKQGGKLYSKCIKPKYITPRLCLQREFDICIPDSVHFNHPDLMVIPVQEFQLIYSELVTFHGLHKKHTSSSCVLNTHTAFGEGTFPGEISYPNPWRICAQNRVIRNVPITLYADDTSGNQSKRWNKHVSYCFTLSGLSPKLTNMEYNCHFIATSNQAGPLEIAEPIIAELNELATHGSIAYDAQLGQAVLFMTDLCYIGSYAFQTHIIDMKSYIWNLTNHIRHFLYAISKISGRQANKPKLHVLLHLPGSIRRFGPASLLATEKFESFHGIVMTHAIHFNKKSPGKDLAISFGDFQIKRALFLGTRLYDHKDKRYFQASQGILDFFANNPLIQQSLAYNSDLISSSHYPCQHGHYGPQPPEEQISVRLKTKFHNSNIKKVAAIKISSKKIHREGSWVLVSIKCIVIVKWHAGNN